MGHLVDIRVALGFGHGRAAWPLLVWSLGSCAGLVEAFVRCGRGVLSGVLSLAF